VTTAYRKVSDMTADEVLACLGSKPRKQIDIFIALGGDPTDHNYARLSFLTMELRRRGVPVQSSRMKGLWLS
jgi:hypothetical protein